VRDILGLTQGPVKEAKKPTSSGMTGWKTIQSQARGSIALLPAFAKDILHTGQWGSDCSDLLCLLVRSP